MKRYDYFKFLVIILMLIFITGCTSIITTPSEPVINSFTADPLTITTGESSTLSWDVSNATSLSIDHEVGSSLALISSASVSPTATTTYTLTAINATGTVTAMVQVVVTTEPSVEKPDLVITGINKTETTSGYKISYTIKNQGTADAGTSASRLLANGVYEGSDTVPSIAAGASVDRQFTWIYNPTTPRIKVYTDVAHTVDESNEDNNNLEVTFEVEEVYDFIDNAGSAIWVGSPPYTSLTFDDFNNPNGFACYRTNIKMEDGITYSKVLETHPKWVDDGLIYGVYMYPVGYEVKVGEHFFAQVGLLQGAGAGKVKFYVIIRLEGGEETTIAEVKDSYDGTIKTIDVPLQAYVGKRVLFRLEVRANGSSAQDWAAWVEAKIIR
jgi:hypothetical protein